MANFTAVALKMWAYRPQNCENMVIFGTNLTLMKNSGSPQKKLNIAAHATRNLPVCNDTITVVKITLLHSVSVITNCVIPKRDKQTDRPKTSHFFVYSRRATYDPHHTWHGDRGGPSHFYTP